METEGGGDGEQSGSNSAPTKASGQPSDYLAERQQRLNVSWNVGVRARNAGGDASMMRGRPSFGMDGWEVEEEQRKDMSSSLVSHLGSPMVHGTGVSPPPRALGDVAKQVSSPRFLLFVFPQQRNGCLPTWNTQE